MRLLICGFLVLGLAQVAIAGSNLSSSAKRELKASKENTKKCKMMIIKAARADHPNNDKHAKKQYDKTLDTIDDFCDGGVKWFEGCKVLNSSRDKCAFIQVDKETRLNDGRKKYFPKNFR